MCHYVCLITPSGMPRPGLCSQDCRARNSLTFDDILQPIVESTNSLAVCTHGSLTWLQTLLFSFTNTPHSQSPTSHVPGHTAFRMPAFILSTSFHGPLQGWRENRSSSSFQKKSKVQKTPAISVIRLPLFHPFSRDHHCSLYTAVISFPSENMELELSIIISTWPTWNFQEGYCEFYLVYSYVKN